MAEERLIPRLLRILGVKEQKSTIRIDSGTFHGVPLIAVAGDIDHHTAQELRKSVEDALRRGHHRLILDLEAVTYMDSGGMSLLFDMVRTVRDDGWIGVIRPGPNIQRLLEITGLYGQDGIHIFASPEEARTALDEG